MGDDIIYNNGGLDMLRDTCPFCGKYVNKGADTGKIINGRGKYKTTIMYHFSCYDKYCKGEIRYEAKHNATYQKSATT